MSGRRKSSIGVVPSASSTAKMDQTRLRIEKMEAERFERRRAMQLARKERQAENEANIAAGNPGDVDFIGMVRQWRHEHAHMKQPHEENSSNNNSTDSDDDLFETNSNNNDDDDINTPQQQPQPPPLCVCVRKRPLSDKERSKITEHDSVTCLNPHVTIHSAKFKVDGITKYLDHATFRLDHAFDEHCETELVYTATTLPLVKFASRGTGGRATVFCYGQTGSGKTYTMNGIYQFLVQDLFAQLLNNNTNDATSCCSLENTRVMVSFFELYGGSVQDLLQDDRPRLKILEDARGEIVVTGLSEVEATSANALLQILQRGMASRTTHTTEANDESSRSHAICQILLRSSRNEETSKSSSSTSRRRNKKTNGGAGGGALLRGKISLVDLAGSERGTDTKSHNAQRRAESSDINTSLLALKECIRALDKNKNKQSSSSTSQAGTALSSKHVPYRGSKLTLILKDCFTSPQAMTTMIATVSPGASATDHSLNTLRYADRIKEQRVVGVAKSMSKKKNISRSTSSPMPTGSRDNSKSNTRSFSASPQRQSSSIPNTGRRISTAAAAATTTTGIPSPARSANSSAVSPARSAKSTATSTENHLLAANDAPPALASPVGSETEEDYNDDDDNGDGLSSCLSDSLERPGILEQEGEILSLHMQHIQENADLLTDEGEMLKDIQHKMLGGNAVTDQELDDYVEALASVLDRKEEMIGLLQDKVMNFKEQQQQQEEQLSADKVVGVMVDGEPTSSLVSTSVSADSPP